MTLNFKMLMLMQKIAEGFVNHFLGELASWLCLNLSNLKKTTGWLVHIWGFGAWLSFVNRISELVENGWRVVNPIVMGILIPMVNPIVMGIFILMVNPIVIGIYCNGYILLY